MTEHLTRVAAYQGWPTRADIASNAAVIRSVIARSAALGVDLLVFPEMFLTGYMVRELIPDLAQPLDSDALTSIQSASRESGVVTVLGFPEALCSNRYGNSAVVIDSGGEIAGVHRKVHLFGDEASIFTPGDRVEVVRTAVGKVGVAICYDIEFPEMARELSLAGADLIAVSTANMVPYRGVQSHMVRSRAWENGLPLVLANHLGADAYYTYFGDSCIVDGNGTVLRQASGASDLIFADLNLEDSPPHHDEYLSARRPKVYRRLAHVASENDSPQ